MGMNDKHNYDPTKWVDNSEPDIDAEHLNKIESALQEYGVSIDELAAAGGTAAKVKTTDTYGLVVSALGESTAQALIDAIANKVMNELINKNKIVNNLLATDASTVLAGTQGTALDKRLVAAEKTVAQLNSDKQTSLKVKDISIKTSNYNFGNNMGGVITNIPCKSLIGDFEKILNAEIATWSACNTHTIIMLDSKGTYLTIWQAEKTSESELEIRFVYV